MATSPVNNLKKELGRKSMFDAAGAVLSSAVNINQGDLVAMDTSSHILKAVTADTDDQKILGVSPVTIVSGQMKSPYSTSNDAAIGASELPGPRYGNVHGLKLHTGDAFNPGDLVYLSTADDAQTVTSVQGGGAKVAIGVYQGSAIASAAAGQLGDILVGCRFPDNSLKF
jgi:hypothetical protein